MTPTTDPVPHTEVKQVKPVDKVYRCGAHPPQDPEERKIAIQLLGQAWLYREDVRREYNVQAQAKRERVRSDEDAHVLSHVYDLGRQGMRAARAKRGHLVDCGTYWLVEDAMLQASKASGSDPIKKKHFDETGTIGAAIQSREQFYALPFVPLNERGERAPKPTLRLGQKLWEAGMIQPDGSDSCEATSNGSDSSPDTKHFHLMWNHKRVKLTYPNERGYALLTLIVGELKNGKALTFPIRLPRAFPPGAIVKRVALQRFRKNGHRYRWHALFTLSWNEEERDLDAQGVVGVDLGWRREKDLGRRVATWEGQHENSQDGGKVHIDIERRFLYSDAVRSIRDLNFDLITDYAAEARIPGAEHARLWKDKNRVRRLHARTPELAKSFEGPSIAAPIHSWLHRDKHLEDIECGVRERAVRRRLDTYRVFANMLAKKYRYVVLEDMPMIDFVGEGETAKRERSRSMAALSLLQMLIAQRFGPHRAHWVNPAYSTRACDACGEVHSGSVGAALEWSCAACGVTHDQDVNAASNLRRAGEDWILNQKKEPLPKARRAKKGGKKSEHQGVATGTEVRMEIKEREPGKLASAAE